MANRRPQIGGRRADFGRNDRNKAFGRSNVSPWQGGAPAVALPNLLPLASGSTEATLALASNLINLLQPRQNTVPSLLDMPIRRDFGPDLGRFDRGFGNNRMGNQGNFRRSGNYARTGDRIGNRKPNKPNDGQKQQNRSTPKKDADSKSKPVKESEEEKKDGEKTDKEKEEETKKDTPKNRYDEINPELLKCHICNKSMWDGRSFENHLSGRAHAIMMQKTAESYALTADTMRQEFKIREMKRTRKSGQQMPRDFYCAMCDLYAADGPVHRTTVGHRKLKKFLHPPCITCHKEMPTRIELDEHRLTIEHLKNMQDKQEVVTVKPKPEVIVISTLSTEQSYLLEDQERRRRYNDNKKESETKGDEENKEGNEDTEQKDEGAKEESQENEKKIDNEDTVLDFKETDDLTTVTSEMFPVYSADRPVGKSFLTEFRCIQCNLCRKLLDTEETAEVHLRTRRHHQLFTRMLSEKSGAKANQDKQEEASKRHLPTEESGNWKRRKTSPELDEEEQIEQNGEDVDSKEVENVEKTEPQEEEPAVDAEMPPAEDLEDWEQSVDEILNDEKDNTEADEKETEKEPEKEVTPPATPIVTDKKTRGTPRGRARGRRRN